MSQSAVSLALRGVPGVSETERRRIRQIARKLNYRPAADAQRLAGRKSASRRGGPLIAWINQEPAEKFWHQHPISRAYWEGASRRAVELGYRLEEITATSHSTASLAAHLYHRGIEGVIFPLYGESVLDLSRRELAPFSAVTLNHAPHNSPFDHVQADFQHNLDLAWTRAVKPGQRAGLILKRIFDLQTQGVTRSRFLFHQKEEGSVKIPPLLVPDTLAAKSQALAAWTKRWKPDLLFVRDYEIPLLLKENRLLSKNLRVIQLQLNDRTGNRGGIDEHNRYIGATAAELVCAKLHAPANWKHEISRDTLIKGCWVP